MAGPGHPANGNLRLKAAAVPRRKALPPDRVVLTGFLQFGYSREVSISRDLGLVPEQADRGRRRQWSRLG